MATTSAPVALTYKTIRRDYQTHCAIEPVLVDHYAKLLSPLLTPWFVRFGIIPNVVTVFMMISGIIGAALFAVPLLWAKVAGLVFIHLWYVLDCCDGEVARITRRFSRMGTEIDYTAHLVNHPLFNIAFAVSLIQLHRYSTPLILFIAIISISAELMLRNLLALRSILDFKSGSAPQVQEPDSVWPLAKRTVARFLSLYPNFALAFPVVVLADVCFGTSFAIYSLFAQTLISGLAAAKGYLGWVRQILWA